MQIRNLSDSELLERTTSLVRKEREVVLELLHHLREVERRRLFARMGYSSLFYYLTDHHGYCEGSAHLRIQAMRLIRDVPEAEKAIEDGRLSLTSAAAVQTFFVKEEREVSVSSERKLEVLAAVEHKSKRETEAVLGALATFPEKRGREYRFELDGEAEGLLEELRSMLPHRDKNELMKQVLALALRQVRGRVKSEKGKDDENLQPGADRDSVADSGSRYVPLEMKRIVWRRDGGKCTYVEPRSGRRCGQRNFLEYEHFKPFSLGGATSPENPTLHCRAHNQLAAIERFGTSLMSKFVGGLR